MAEKEKWGPARRVSSPLRLLPARPWHPVRQPSWGVYLTACPRTRGLSAPPLPTGPGETPSRPKMLSADMAALPLLRSCFLYFAPGGRGRGRRGAGGGPRVRGRWAWLGERAAAELACPQPFIRKAGCQHAHAPSLQSTSRPPPPNPWGSVARRHTCQPLCRHFRRSGLSTWLRPLPVSCPPSFLTSAMSFQTHLRVSACCCHELWVKGVGL